MKHSLEKASISNWLEMKTLWGTYVLLKDTSKKSLHTKQNSIKNVKQKTLQIKCHNYRNVELENYLISCVQ